MTNHRLERGYECINLPLVRHPRRIDDEIRRELKKRFPDSIRLLRMKKLRLAVKDRLHRHFPTRAKA